MEDCSDSDDDMKLPNSNTSKCFICYTKIEKTEEPAPTAFQKNVVGDGSLPSASLLLRQLRAIFILKHLFNYPSQKLAHFLESKGNPADWFEICHVCNEKVNRAKVIFDELQCLKLKISRARSRFTNTKFNFKEQVKGTSSLHDGEDDPAFQFVVECRKLICQGKAKDPPPSLAQLNRESSGLGASRDIEAENNTGNKAVIPEEALPLSSPISDVDDADPPSEMEEVSDPVIEEKDEVPSSSISHVDDVEITSVMEVNKDLPSIEVNEKILNREPHLRLFEHFDYAKSSNSKRSSFCANTSSKVKEKSQFSCNLCNDNQVCPLWVLVRHVKKFHLVTYKCKICPRGFPVLKYGSVQNHWTHMHKDKLNDFPEWKQRTVKVTPQLPSIPWWCPNFGCPESFEDHTSRDNHLEVCPLSKLRVKKRYYEECEFCPKLFLSTSEVKLHELIDHQDKHLGGDLPELCEVAETTEDGKRVATIFFEPEESIVPSTLKAEQNVEKVITWQGHTSVEGGQEPGTIFRCPKCPGKSFRRRRNLINHNKSFHLGGLVRYSCDLCEVTRSNKRCIPYHKAKVHNIDVDKFHCSNCDKWFYSELLKMKHVCGEDLNRERFPCPKCGKLFANKNSLRRHEDHVHDKRHIKCCHLCGKPVTRVQYDFHLASVHSIGDFQCPEESCTKVFSKQKNLDEHIKFDHKGEFNYVCEICGKGYKIQDSLTRHKQLMHEREKTLKQFKCNLCDKSFAMKKYLKTHIDCVHEKKPNWRKKRVRPSMRCPRQ